MDAERGDGGRLRTDDWCAGRDGGRGDGRRHGRVRVRVRVRGARSRVGALASAFALALASLPRAYGANSPFTTKADLQNAVDACTGSMVGCVDGNGISISNWDVSGVDDMSNMFSGKSDFNADISSWNVERVTKMNNMFSIAHAFNQDITGWNVAAVTSMSSMFYGARAFNQDISSWNDAAVTSYSGMFYSATAWLSACFRTDGSSSTDGPASAWECAPFSSPFSRRDKLKATIDSCLSSDNTGATCVDANGVSISNWDVSGVTDMSYLFQNKAAFNADITGWDVAAVTDMSYMFASATAFNQDTGSWNVAAVTNMQSMFYQATAFNQDISSWNDAAVTSYGGMFNSATAWTSLCLRTDGSSSTDGPASAWLCAPFSSPFSYRSALKMQIDSCLSSDNTGATCVDANGVSISNWDVSGVTDMNRLFQNKAAFNADISSWNVAAVTNMYYMFASATAFNQDISSWNDAAVTSYGGMFNSATAWTSACFRTDGSSSTDGPASAWLCAPFSSPFSYRSALKMTIDSCLSSDSTGATCVDRNSVSISNWDVSGVTDMSYLFQNKAAFNADISSWNVPAVTNMRSMFYEATAFNQDITGWETTAIDAARSQSTIASMFVGATAWLAAYEQTVTPMWDNVYDGPSSRWQAIGGSPAGSPGASNATDGADGESYPDWAVGLTTFTFALSVIHSVAVILLYRTVRAKNRAANIAAQMRILPNAPLSPPPPQPRQNVATPGTVVVQMR